MSVTLLQFDFPFDGPWAGALSAQLEGLAHDIATEDGLIWKIWTENESQHRAGGIYLFADPTAAERYRRKHEARLSAFGIDQVVARSFAVNTQLSAVTRAPL
jgi:hypothetical protein